MPSVAPKPMNYTDLLRTLEADGNGATLDLTPDWLQGRTAYGGWQAALALLAMRRVVGEAIPLRSLQANFIAPVPPGRVTARAELLRQGKSAAQLEARIVIDGQTAFTALGIFGAPRDSTIVERPRAPLVRPAGECPALPFIPGVIPEFQRHFDMRWASGGLPFSGGAHDNASIHVRYCDVPMASEAHLVCAADAIPPSAIAMYRAPTPVSSMNWTLEMVRPLADAARDGWLRFDASLTAAGEGYGFETASIWSDDGELVALSRQCVALFG